jgi:putative transposase
MPAKRFSVEQIVAKLREAEKLQGQGLTIPQVCKRLGISDQTSWGAQTRSSCKSAHPTSRPS